VLLAGCTTGPFGDLFGDDGAPVHIGNEANDTYRFELLTAEIGQDLTVRYRNGDTQVWNMTAGAFGSESEPGNPITAIERPEKTAERGTYVLGPGEERNLTVAEVRQDEALLVVVSHAETGRIYGLHGANCRPGYFTEFSVTVRRGPGYNLDWSSSCAS